jgi:hypothetical protein
MFGHPGTSARVASTTSMNLAPPGAGVVAQPVVRHEGVGGAGAPSCTCKYTKRRGAVDQAATERKAAGGSARGGRNVQHHKNCPYHVGRKQAKGV